MGRRIVRFVKKYADVKFPHEAATELARFFTNALTKEFSDLSPDTLLSSKPALYHNLFSADRLPPALLDTLHEMRFLVPSLGFRYLVWLVISGIRDISKNRNKPSDDDSSDEYQDTLIDEVDAAREYMSELDDDLLLPYSAWVDHVLDRSTDESEHPFLLDCRACVEESMDLFVHMVPYIFTYLPEYTQSYRLELVQLIVSNVDPTHMELLTCKLMFGEFEMVADRAASLIEQSLQWESITQLCFWQFLVAEVADDCETVVLDALRLLKGQCEEQPTPLGIHPFTELTQGIIMLSRPVEPSAQILKAVLALPLSFVGLSCGLFNRWCGRHPSSFFPQLFHNLKNVIARSVDNQQHQETNANLRRHDNRKLAKRVAGHLDGLCHVFRLQLQSYGDNQNIAVLLGLLQRVIRAYGFNIDKYRGLSGLQMERSNQNEAARVNKKRKRASLGSSREGETDHDHERRKSWKGSQDGSPSLDKKKAKLTRSVDVGLSGEDPPNTLEQHSNSRHSSGEGRNSPRPLDTAGHALRRSSNGSIDESTTNKPKPKHSSLPGVSSHWRELPKGEEARGERGDKGEAEAAKKRKVKRISMDHEPEYEQE